MFSEIRRQSFAGVGIIYNRELPASWGSPQVNSFPSTSISIADLFGFGNCPVAPATFAYPVNPTVFNGCGTRLNLRSTRNLKTAMAQQWSLNVQHDLKFGILQVGYVGNHVTHLLTDGVVSPRNLNRADIDFFGFNLTARPQFGDVFLVGTYPSSNYNSMQATFKRNLSTGIRFNFNYTWGHTIDDVVGFFKDYQDEFNAKQSEQAATKTLGTILPLTRATKFPGCKAVDGDRFWLADFDFISIQNCFAG